MLVAIENDRAFATFELDWDDLVFEITFLDRVLRAPMAFAVLGGLVVSTVLSLLVVPAFYVVADHGSVRVRGWVARWRGRREEFREAKGTTPSGTAP